MKRFNLFALLVGLFVVLPALANAAGASRYVNGTEIKQGVVLVNTTDAQTISGAVTLSSTLAVTGATTHTGAVTFTAPSLVGVGGAVAATGSSKTDCTALTKEYNTITGTALQGVCLLTAATGLHQVVYNDSAVTLIVYPLDAGNDTLAVNDLAALTADVGYAVGPLGTLDCTAYTTTAWHCVYTMGARGTVAATGSLISDGTALTSAAMGSFVAVTAANATKAITLPTGGSATTYVPGCIQIQSTVNTNTAYLPVFGNNSDDDTINGGSADAVYAMGAGASVRFCSIDGVAWLTR